MGTQNIWFDLYSFMRLSESDTPRGTPDVLMIGDSWFFYPGTNLAEELARIFPNLTFLVMGMNGAEAKQWHERRLRKEIDLAFKWYARTCKALLLSGGGNDVAGSEDFDPIIKDNCKGLANVCDCYSPGEPEAVLSEIAGYYRLLVAKFRHYNKAATVICHNYENAWPTGKGVFGPADWLKAPMDTAHVPAGLRHPLFADLLAKLHDMQAGLSRETACQPFVALKTAGTLPDRADIWKNELHLKPEYFAQMARLQWAPELAKALGVPRDGA